MNKELTKREKQIVEKAKQRENESGGFSDFVHRVRGVDSAYGIGFLEGAAWSDENPKEGLVDIDNVINILKTIDYKNYISYIVSGVGTINFEADRFINDLTKLIENENL